MKKVGLLLVVALSFAALIMAQGNQPSSHNNPREDPTSFSALGNPDPEASRGDSGTKQGGEGFHKFQDKGEKGQKGEVGSMGIKGMMGEAGAKGPKGAQGNEGSLGPTSAPGLPGPQGVQGEPGNTVLNEEELARRVAAINAPIIQEIKTVRLELEKEIEALQKNTLTLCGIHSHDWTRVAYLDTTQGQTCPPALRTFTNTTTNQKACGTPYTTRYDAPAVSMIFPTNKQYTHVCGRVRGYAYHKRISSRFYQSGTYTIDRSYADGVSITMGSPRQHLWTYTIGSSDNYQGQAWACPCSRLDLIVPAKIPYFIGQQYYCESAFDHSTSVQGRIVWEDALWDGKNCVTEGNACCDRFGWFHREVAPTQDSIEVRWMRWWKSFFTEVMTDQLEIWVL